MEEVNDTSLYKYTSEVIVEITGVDSNGEFATVSYQFAFDDKESVVRPKGDVDPQHKHRIEATLNDADYTLTES